MNESNRLLLSGDEAIALAARHAGVAFGAGRSGPLTPQPETARVSAASISAARALRIGI